MKIVAFLQNIWVNNPDRARECIARRGEEYRRRLIAYALFSGCLTGKRLKAAFGEDLCKQILWEEASREIAGNARKVCKPDHAHIAAVLERERPDIVLAFGQMAGAAVAGLWHGPLIYAPHPAARQAYITHELRRAAQKLRSSLN